MKSEKATEFIEKTLGLGKFLFKADVIQAAEIAEQEMQEKAIEAHIYSCFRFSNGHCIGVSGIIKCEYNNCNNVKKFINKLNTK